MASEHGDFGRLLSMHGASAAAIQRAAIVSGLASVFFIIMIGAFLVRGHFFYLLLAGAFFVVLLFTVLGWSYQKRNVLAVYENGLSYGTFASKWKDIETIADPDKRRASGDMAITDKSGRTITIPASLQGRDVAVALIRSKIDEGRLQSLK